MKLGSPASLRMERRPALYAREPRPRFVDAQIATFSSRTCSLTARDAVMSDNSVGSFWPVAATNTVRLASIEVAGLIR